MILAVRGQNRELRFGEYAARIPSPPTYSSGQVVTYDSAVGIAAVGRAIRVVSGMAASMPIRVYTGRRGEKQERPETSQARLLETPVFGQSDFDWRWDIVSSLEICENAFLYKRRDRKGIVELEFIPYWAVTASLDRQTGAKKFEVQEGNGKKRILGVDEVLHVRGQTVGGGSFGVSRITQHRDPLGSIQAAQKFEGRFFGNDARPQTAYIFPQGVSRAQAQEWKADIEADFGGDNYGRPMVAGGGLQITPLPINLQDAQFIEGKQVSVEEVGRIMDVAPILLGVQGNARGDKKDALQHFLHVQLPPRLRRIERSFHADPDFFGSRTDLYPEFEVNELMFADPLTRAQVQHYRVQDGTELVDEARADNGRGALPPIPENPELEPGKIPQVTPVGGAPALPMPSLTEE